MDKSKQLILDIINYYTYPFHYNSTPAVKFYDSYIELTLLNKNINVYAYINEVRKMLKDAGVYEVKLEIASRYTINIFGINTEEEVDQVRCLLRLNGILK